MKIFERNKSEPDLELYTNKILFYMLKSVIKTLQTAKENDIPYDTVIQTLGIQKDEYLNKILNKL